MGTALQVVPVALPQCQFGGPDLTPPETLPEVSQVTSVLTPGLTALRGPV